MLISYMFIDCKVKGIFFITRSASWDCLARQSFSIDVLYNREFKSDDKVNISAEYKYVDVTIATDDHNKLRRPDPTKEDDLIQKRKTT